MSEPGFREIQLNTKQVVFLFIAGLVAAVVIFLLGVSVGRGVASPETTAGASQPAEPAAAEDTAAVAMPAPTAPKPDELKYHDVLQGKDAKVGAAAPPTPPDSPPDAKPAPSSTPTPTPSPQTKPAVTAPATKAAPPATGADFFVQVDSFGSKANADRQLARLKTIGVGAFIFEAPGPGAKYKVRVGPFADRSAAVAMETRLRKEGFRPSVIR